MIHSASLARGMDCIKTVRSVVLSTHLSLVFDFVCVYNTVQYNTCSPHTSHFREHAEVLEGYDEIPVMGIES